MRMLWRSLALFIILIGVRANAGTFIVPDDDVLIVRASAGIVSGTVVDSRSEMVPDRGLHTTTRLWIERVHSGPFAAGDVIEIVEPGGVTPAFSLQLHGVPRFSLGDRVLLLLAKNGRGELTTLEFALGKFTYRKSEQGTEYLLRDGDNICGWSPEFEPYKELARRADGFVRHIESIAGGNSEDVNYGEDLAKVCVSGQSALVATPEAAVDYSFCGCRWCGFNGPAPAGCAGAPSSVNFSTNGIQAGIADSLGAVDAGTGVWSSEASANINFGRGGTSSLTNAFNCVNGSNVVVFNDPGNEISGSFTGSGVLAIGGPCFGGAHTFNGSAFAQIIQAGVLVQDGVSSATGISQGEFEAILAHELGHTLGFRHSNESGAPGSTTQALMNSILNRSSAFLSTWDSAAAAAMYGSGSTVCTGVSISAQPQSAAISSGSSRTLTVTAGGTGPFAYQWYEGTSGTTTTPVGTNSPTYNTGALNQTTSYWVRITNCSGANTANSNTATITVTCSASVTQQPQSQSVPSSGSTTLSVGVGAGSYTFQWYKGSSGDTSNPVGANSSTFNTGALTSAASFWVKVTRTDCDPDSVVNSSTATVSICEPVAIVGEPQDATVISGTGTMLSATASGSGTKTYQWYRGVRGNTANKVNGATSSSLSTGALTSTTQYWVRVANTCGGVKTADSRTATVTVQASCVQPLITAQPQSTTISENSSATVTVTATGNSLLYQWYVGTTGNTSQPVGSNSPSFSTGALTQTKSYWVRISNACGQANSATVTVTVQPSCPAGALCALGGRFQLSLAVRDHRTGKTGTGTPLSQNDIFGFYSLPSFTGDPNNPEVFVKMLDGRPVNGSFWTFFGGLTDLEYTLTVKDTQTGGTKTYSKPGGSSAGGFDVGAGATPETCASEVDGTALTNESPTICTGQTDRLCLSNSRFRVTLAARDQRTGATGAGRSIPQSAIFGYFSIPALTGNTTNPEVFVKVIDARGFNGFYWVFFSGLTDFEYTITVTDTFTGRKKSYKKQPGSACGAFDTNAFTGQ